MFPIGRNIALHRSISINFKHSSIPKLTPIFLGGVCVCDQPLGDGEWGVVVELGQIGFPI